jgi:hypothetical protein
MTMGTSLRLPPGGKHSAAISSEYIRLFSRRIAFSKDACHGARGTTRSHRSGAQAQDLILIVPVVIIVKLILKLQDLLHMSTPVSLGGW